METGCCHPEGLVDQVGQEGRQEDREDLEGQEGHQEDREDLVGLDRDRAQDHAQGLVPDRVDHRLRPEEEKTFAVEEDVS
jgi:hypothetical protein